MDLSGVFTIVFLVVAVILLIPLLIGGIFIVVVVANRAEPDPSGRRPALVYASGVAFLTLFITLFASTSFVAALCRLIGSHHQSSGGGSLDFFGSDSASTNLGHQHPLGDSVARQAVLSAIVALIAGVVCWLHMRAAARASDDAVGGVDPLARVRSSYVAAVSFAAVFIVVGSVIVVIYDIFLGAAPGVFSSSGRGGSVEVLRTLIPALFLALAAAAILLAHLRNAPPPFRPGVFGSRSGGPTAAPAVVEEPVEAEVVIVTKTSAAPRKRAPRKTTGG